MQTRANLYTCEIFFLAKMWKNGFLLISIVKRDFVFKDVFQYWTFSDETSEMVNFLHVKLIWMSFFTWSVTPTSLFSFFVLIGCGTCFFRYCKFYIRLFWTRNEWQILGPPLINFGAHVNMMWCVPYCFTGAHVLVIYRNNYKLIQCTSLQILSYRSVCSR